MSLRLLQRFCSPVSAASRFRSLATAAAVEQAYKGGSQGNPIKVPLSIEDIESTRAMEFGAELDADHPGFTDTEYRKRRKIIAELGMSHKMSQPIPRVNYSASEVETWAAVYSNLKQLFPTHACSNFNRTFAMLNYKESEIPQLETISQALRDTTGWRLRPVVGLLPSRDFLNGLAFKVFHSTQYIRHHTKPLYTPEPDICHELLGHVPMLMDPEFARLSQIIGQASLGVSDEDISRLSTVYWFSIEFGLVKEGGFLKAYGAGLLSSFGELQNSLSGKPEYRPFDPPVTALQEYPITRYQPILYVADSFARASEQLLQFSKTLNHVA